MRMSLPRRVLLALIVAAGAVPAYSTVAAQGSEVDSKRADLDALKRRIDELD